jgi:phospholipid/cholesterol/gamma-HCH transport system substrate-binding protein
MIRRKTKVQLLVFALVTLVTVSILSARFVGLTDRIMGGTYLVSADFVDSGGIFQGSEATYRGVTVGKVEALQLEKGGVLVRVRFNRGTQIPRDTLAVVENRSAVGEQYIDFQPRTAHGPMLAAGSVVPRADTRSPVRIDNLLLHLDRTVQSVDQKRLGIVVDELGTAFADGGTDLQRLLDSGDALTSAATEALPQTVKLIDDGKTVLNTQRVTSGNIKDLSRNFADLSETLKGSDGDLRLVLDRGAVASRELDGLIRDNQGSLATLLTNFITIGQVTDAHINGIEQLMVTYPDVVAGGYTVVPGDGTAHFGLVLNVNDPQACTAGYGGTQRIGPDQSTNLPPVNTGARCTLPRGSSSSVRGAQNAPPGTAGAGSSSPSSYPLALSETPVPLGNPAVTSDGHDSAGSTPVISMPTAPAGAVGTARWIWLMTGAAR